MYTCIRDSDSRINDLVLEGTPVSDTYQYIKINLEQCKNGTATKCKSQQDIDSYFNDLQMRIVYLNTLVDLKDYETPVKIILEEPLVIQA